jgi:hypothetical protein
MWIYQGSSYSFDFENRQYPQIISGEYTTMHPLAHTWMCQILLSLWHDFHIILVVQLLMVAFVGIMMLQLGKLMRIPFIPVISCVLLLFWQFPLFTTVIKDVPYCVAFLLLIEGVCFWIFHKKTLALTLISIGMFGVSTMRYDGMATAIVISGILLIYLLKSPMNRKPILIPIFSCLLGCLCSMVLLPFLSHASSVATGTKYAKMAHIICDVVAEGGTIKPSDIELIEKEIMPREVILRQYHLYDETMSPVISSGHGEKYIWPPLFGNGAEAGKEYSFAWNLSDKGELIRNLFLSVVLDNPFLSVKSFLLNSQMVWNLGGQKSFEASSLIGLLVFRMRDIPVLFLCYSALLAFLVYRYHRGWLLLVPFVPLFCVSSVIMMAATTYELRYLLPVNISFPLLFLYTIGIMKLPQTRKLSTQHKKTVASEEATVDFVLLTTLLRSEIVEGPIAKTLLLDPFGGKATKKRNNQCRDVICRD